MGADESKLTDKARGEERDINYLVDVLNIEGHSIITEALLAGWSDDETKRELCNRITLLYQIYDLDNNIPDELKNQIYKYQDKTNQINKQSYRYGIPLYIGDYSQTKEGVYSTGYINKDTIDHIYTSLFDNYKKEGKTDDEAHSLASNDIEKNAIEQYNYIHGDKKSLGDQVCAKLTAFFSKKLELTRKILKQIDKNKSVDYWRNVIVSNLQRKISDEINLETKVVVKHLLNQPIIPSGINMLSFANSSTKQEVFRRLGQLNQLIIKELNELIPLMEKLIPMNMNPKDLNDIEKKLNDTIKKYNPDLCYALDALRNFTWIDLGNDGFSNPFIDKKYQKAYNLPFIIGGAQQLTSAEELNIRNIVNAWMHQKWLPSTPNAPNTTQQIPIMTLVPIRNKVCPISFE